MRTENAQNSPRTSRTNFRTIVLWTIVALVARARRPDTPVPYAHNLRIRYPDGGFRTAKTSLTFPAR